MIRPSTEYAQFLRTAKETLVSCYLYSRNVLNTPEEAANLLIADIGRDNASEIVSALVLMKGSWDTCISAENRKWAEENCEYTREDLNLVPGFWYCDEIHPAYFNQIVNRIRELTDTREVNPATAGKGK